MRCLFLVRAGLKATILSMVVFTLLFSANSGLESAVQAAIVYDESVDGDLPDYGTSVVPPPAPPKSVGTFSEGSNVVKGTFGTGSGHDSDMFTFFVPASFQLSKILLTYSPDGDPVGGSYYAIQDGTTIGTTFSTVGDNLSNAMVLSSGDLLPLFEAGPLAGGSGLTAPLPSGDYSMFFNETATGVTYSLNFIVTPVPEPTGMTLCGLASLLVLAKRPRRRKCKTQGRNKVRSN